MREQIGSLLFQAFFLARTGDGTQHRCDDFLDHLERANLMWHLATDFMSGDRIQV